MSDMPKRGIKLCTHLLCKRNQRNTTSECTSSSYLSQVDFCHVLNCHGATSRSWSGSLANNCRWSLGSESLLRKSWNHWNQLPFASCVFVMSFCFLRVGVQISDNGWYWRIIYWELIQTRIIVLLAEMDPVHQSFEDNTYKAILGSTDSSRSEMS